MNKWKVMLSSIVIAAALAGCGVQVEQTQAETQAGGEEEVQQYGTDGRPQRSDPGAEIGQIGVQADVMGKSESIDKNKSLGE